MFLRCHSRKKNGKSHRYWSVVESRRLGDGSTTQRQLLYLGEINDSQQAAWRRTLEVFDEDRGRSCQLSLFPDDRREVNCRTVSALSGKGWWRRSHSPPVQEGLSVRWFTEQGAIGLLDQYVRLQR